MPPDVKIVHLVDVPETISILVRWFIEEWEPYYGSSGPGDAQRDLTSCCNRADIPLAIVALDVNGNPVGTAALKPHSLDSHRHLSPWLAALLVERGQRRKGVASALIAAIEDEARRLGFDTLYSDTGSGSTLLQRRSWQELEVGIPTLREPATLYCLELNPPRD